MTFHQPHPIRSVTSTKSAPEPPKYLIDGFYASKHEDLSSDYVQSEARGIHSHDTETLEYAQLYDAYNPFGLTSS